MSEEQQKASNGEEQKTKPHDAGEPAGNHGEMQSGNDAGKATRPLDKANPIVLLLFMILLMVVVLTFVSLNRAGSKGAGESPDDSAMATLKADLEARRSELNRQRIAMGLPPLEGSSEPIEDIGERLKNDADTLVGLAGRFQQMLSEKDAQISQGDSEALRLEKLRQDVSMENARLQSELNRALLVSTEVDQLKRSLADLQAQRDALSMELADTRTKLSEAAGSVNADDYSDLQRRYEEALRSKDFFEARTKELEALLNKAQLFAKSENELLPAAVELFRRLRKLEGMKDSDLTTEYSKLGVELGANVLHTLEYKTGSSELNTVDMERLAAISQSDMPDGDLTLIIGYASKTGDALANEKLSSNRATVAAEHFSTIKRSGQLVQAVYLGQTDRFSSRVPERNQICEVWRIRRK
jgi:outer membrane protein OmpA-like peptidoglycan-associated protein